jgi:hypothetical protein
LDEDHLYSLAPSGGSSFGGMDPGFGDLEGGIDDPFDGQGPDFDLGIEMDPIFPGGDFGPRRESVGFGGMGAALHEGVNFGGVDDYRFDMDIDQPGMLIHELDHIQSFTRLRYFS